MSIFRAIGIILATYTRIPMPSVEWKPENLRYALCFLPLPGILIAVAEIFWLVLATMAELSTAFYAVIAGILPVVLTGGIHMDGLVDTTDALRSYAAPARKRAILEDPHTGAFGNLSMVLHLILTIALYYEMYILVMETALHAPDGSPRTALLSMYHYYHIPALLLIIYMTSRTLTAFSMVSIKPSKRNGMMYAMVSRTNRMAVRIEAFCVILCCMVMMVLLFQIWALAYIIPVFVCHKSFRRMVLREFGGISGDLCGWYIQTLELVLLAIMVLCIRLL